MWQRLTKLLSKEMGEEAYKKKGIGKARTEFQKLEKPLWFVGSLLKAKLSERVTKPAS